MQLSEVQINILKSIGIDGLIVFGSRSQGVSRPTSDFDFGLLLKDKRRLFDIEARKKIYDQVYEVLSNYLNQLVNIDIVFLEDTTYELRAHVMKYGQVIFESRPGIFADFKDQVMSVYSDMAPLRLIFQRETLARIS